MSVGLMWLTCFVLLMECLRSMVFITTSNAARIVRKIDPKSLSRLTGELYEKRIFMFSDREKQRLLAIKELLRNPVDFINEYYVEAKVVDTGRYVIPEKEPRYHSTTECERLNSDWFNYPIPAPIQARGWDEIKRFRHWWRENALLYEEHRERFYIRLSADFNVPLTQIDRVEAVNSGVQSFENLDLPSLKKMIEELLRNAGRYYYESEKHTAILKVFQKKTYLAHISEPLRTNNTSYSDDEVKGLLTEYSSQFKQPLQKMLVEYYKVKFNPELSFDGQLLERLGFLPCGSCHK